MSFSEKLIAEYFTKTVKIGQIRVTFASGRHEIYGDGSEDLIAIRFATKKMQRQLILNPDLKIGEGYMNGDLVIEKGNIFDFLSLMARNGNRKHLPIFFKIVFVGMFLINRVKNFWRAATEKRDVAHHYDLDDKLFELFLDDDWQYTCAYFENDEQTLNEAQLAKKRHVTAKLRAGEGDSVLEMGCGWGGLALYIAEMSKAHVTAVTLSENQVKIAKKRAENRGLEKLTEFRLQNYRDVEGTFDRIISIGMLEHVGRQNYLSMFKKSFGLLKKEGVMVVHSIGRPKAVLAQDGFNQRYIFPGGHIPAVSEAVAAAERAGFLIKDVEILPIHYAKTCRMWREKFIQNWDEVASIYDDNFCRMWEYYLAASEVAFLHFRLMIFQLILTKHQDMVPYTRDYIGQETERLRDLETGQMVSDKIDLKAVLK